MKKICFLLFALAVYGVLPGETTSLRQSKSMEKEASLLDKSCRTKDDCAATYLVCPPLCGGCEMVMSKKALPKLQELQEKARKGGVGGCGVADCASRSSCEVTCVNGICTGETKCVQGVCPGGWKGTEPVFKR